LITNTVSQNNITCGSKGYSLTAILGAENDGVNGYGNVYTYNSFGVQASNFIQWSIGTYYSQYQNWEAAAGNCGTVGCTNSLQVDPMLTNPGAGIFTLQAGSPAIGAGTTLSAPYNMLLAPQSFWPGYVVLVSQTNPATIGAYHQ
jgi:hypothetical protein